MWDCLETKVKDNLYTLHSFNFLRHFLRTTRDGDLSSKANNTSDTMIDSNGVISTNMVLEHWHRL